MQSDNTQSGSQSSLCYKERQQTTLDMQNIIDNIQIRSKFNIQEKYKMKDLQLDIQNTDNIYA